MSTLYSPHYVIHTTPRQVTPTTLLHCTPHKLHFTPHHTTPRTRAPPSPTPPPPSTPPLPGERQWWWSRGAPGACALPLALGPLAGPLVLTQRGVAATQPGATPALLQGLHGGRGHVLDVIQVGHILDVIQVGGHMVVRDMGSRTVSVSVFLCCVCMPAYLSLSLPVCSCASLPSSLSMLHCLSFIVYPTLSIPHCLSFTVYPSLSILHCLSFIVYPTLSIPHCLPLSLCSFVCACVCVCMRPCLLCTVLCVSYPPLPSGMLPPARTSGMLPSGMLPPACTCSRKLHAPRFAPPPRPASPPDLHAPPHLPPPLTCRDFYSTFNRLYCCRPPPPDLQGLLLHLQPALLLPPLPANLAPAHAALRLARTLSRGALLPAIRGEGGGPFYLPPEARFFPSWTPLPEPPSWTPLPEPPSWTPLLGPPFPDPPS